MGRAAGRHHDPTLPQPPHNTLMDIKIHEQPLFFALSAPLLPPYGRPDLLICILAPSSDDPIHCLQGCRPCRPELEKGQKQVTSGVFVGAGKRTRITPGVTSEREQLESNPFVNHFPPKKVFGTALPPLKNVHSNISRKKYH